MLKIYIFSGNQWAWGKKSEDQRTESYCILVKYFEFCCCWCSHCYHFCLSLWLVTDAAAGAFPAVITVTQVQNNSKELFSNAG